MGDKRVKINVVVRGRAKCGKSRLIVVFRQAVLLARVLGAMPSDAEVTFTEETTKKVRRA